MASCANTLPRLQIQNLATGVSRRAITASCSLLSFWSKALASLMDKAVAASLSRARSASTLRISGCSMSFLPKAERWRVWCSAMLSACRMRPLVPRAQSSRVMVPISRICATPRPSSPTRQAIASMNSTSELALAWLPSLSFRRWMRIALTVSSGSTRGRKKQVSPPGACARTRNASHIGAEKNHLCPVMR